MLKYLRIAVTALSLTAYVSGHAWAASKDAVKLKVLFVREFSPLMLAQSANALIAMGEEKAVDLLQSSIRDFETDLSFGFSTNERIGWLCRLIFESKSDKPLRAPYFGSLSLPRKSMPTSEWRKYPLAVSKGTVFVLADGYAIVGTPEDPLEYIRYCQRAGQFRKRHYPIPSRTEAEQALSALITSSRWRKIRWHHRGPGSEYRYSERRVIGFLSRQVNRIGE
jgi:hypothetical protein